jgi:Outer membrane protein beta-barrel domain
MFRIVSAFVCLSGTVLFLPLHGQDTEYEHFNFNAGGGFSVPLNPTGRYFGVNGTASTGMGANFNKYNSIEGDFYWSGLSPSISLVHPITRPTGSVNVFNITANYRFHVDSINDSILGFYVLAGGGWFYRHTSVDKHFIAPPVTVCQPIYNWWGYACDSSGYVQSVTVATAGSSALGVDGGAGFTIKLPTPGWKFFVEGRYQYAWSPFIPTTLVPVTFGFRFN